MCHYRLDFGVINTFDYIDSRHFSSSRVLYRHLLFACKINEQNFKGVQVPCHWKILRARAAGNQWTRSTIRIFKVTTRVFPWGVYTYTMGNHFDWKIPICSTTRFLKIEFFLSAAQLVLIPFKYIVVEQDEYQKENNIERY